MNVRCLVTLAAVAVLAGIACADEPPRSHAVREIWDPQTGTWVRQPPPEPGTPAGDLEIAKAALARGEVEAARAMLAAWMTQYPDSPLRPQALFAQADVELQAGEYLEAHRLYEALLDEYPGGELFDPAIKREIVIAEVFLAGKKRKLWKIFRVSAYDEAIDILDRIINERAPRTELVEQALKIKADYHFRQGDFEQAEREYARLAQEFPTGRYHPMALLLSAQAALASFPGTRFDDAALVEAEERFGDLKRRYPEMAEREGVDQILAGIRERRAQKQYEIARFYQRTGHPAAAGYHYRLILRSWPDTTWGAQAEALLTQRPPPEPTPTAPAPTTQPSAPQ